jgi:carbonic anhydrase
LRVTGHPFAIVMLRRLASSLPRVLAPPPARPIAATAAWASDLAVPPSSCCCPQSNRDRDDKLDPLYTLVKGSLNYKNNRHAQLLRHSVAGGQAPLASVVGCADSRVIPEDLLDTSDVPGAIFTNRIAGNAVLPYSDAAPGATAVVMGSIMYPVEHNGTELVLVIGHERCGGVQAALWRYAKGASTPGGGPVIALAESIRANIGDTALKELASCAKVTPRMLTDMAATLDGPVWKEKPVLDFWKRAVKANAVASVMNIRNYQNSVVLPEKPTRGEHDDCEARERYERAMQDYNQKLAVQRARVIAAYYDLDTGALEPVRGGDSKDGDFRRVWKMLRARSKVSIELWESMDRHWNEE